MSDRKVLLGVDPARDPHLTVIVQGEVQNDKIHITVVKHQEQPDCADCGKSMIECSCMGGE